MARNPFKYLSSTNLTLVEKFMYVSNIKLKIPRLGVIGNSYAKLRWYRGLSPEGNEALGKQVIWCDYATNNPSQWNSIFLFLCHWEWHNSSRASFWANWLKAFFHKEILLNLVKGSQNIWQHCPGASGIFANYFILCLSAKVAPATKFDELFQVEGLELCIWGGQHQHQYQPKWKRQRKLF